MPELSKGLVEDLLDHLGGNELAMRIMAELAQARANAPEDTVRIEVPYRFVPHVASAFSVGSVASMMCDESDGAQHFQNDTAKLLRSRIPEALQIYLHRGDRAKIFDLLRAGAEPRLEREKWGSRSTIDYHLSDRVFRFTLSDIGEAILKDEQGARRVFDEISALALRLRPEGPLTQRDESDCETEQATPAP